MNCVNKKNNFGKKIGPLKDKIKEVSKASGEVREPREPRKQKTQLQVPKQQKRNVSAQIEVIKEKNGKRRKTHYC
jgi:hypothetical protein